MEQICGKGLQMCKIILKEVSEDICRWFCESCGKKIDYVPENLFSIPLIDSCPHCKVVFNGYELCERRKRTNFEISKFIADMRKGGAE